MTINEAIATVDATLRNQIDTQQKVQWLSQMDSELHRLVVSLYEKEPTVFPGYGPGTPGTTYLIMPDTFAQGYVHYVTAQIHLLQKEMDEYNNDLEMYIVDRDAFEKWYRRNHTLAAPNTRFLF